MRERDSLLMAVCQLTRLLTFLFCLLELQINFQVAFFTDYFSQASSQSGSLRLTFTHGLSRLLPTGADISLCGFCYPRAGPTSPSPPLVYSSCKFFQATPFFTLPPLDVLKHLQNSGAGDMLSFPPSHVAGGLVSMPQDWSFC